MYVKMQGGNSEEGYYSRLEKSGRLHGGGGGLRGAWKARIHKITDSQSWKGLRDPLAQPCVFKDVETEAQRKAMTGPRSQPERF